MKRIALAIPVLFAILLFVFRLLDTGLESLRPDGIRPGASMSAEEIEARIEQFRQAHHLQDPFLMRFGHWLKRLAQADLGVSLFRPRSVREIIAAAAPTTLTMQGLALLLTFGLGVPIGVFMARRRDRWSDRALGIALYGLFAVPAFWTATLLVTYLATKAGFEIFPLRGLASRDLDEAGFIRKFVVGAWHLVLPVTTLSIAGIVFVARLVRDGLVEELDRDWARTFRAAGVSERRVVWRYALRRVAVPVCAHLGYLVPGLVSGSLVVEQVFDLPGLGRVLWFSTFERDIPVQQGLVLLTALFTLAGFVLSDLLVASLGPRKGGS
ncbi:MAG: ABC transporter permease [Planctomycetes bacterium]|nr:ABC transporter permease [Planctomycetota bacterium]